ncbi:hypothetical protein HDU76_008840, partial [Blyttiomyces sp. JEL0837]
MSFRGRGGPNNMHIAGQAQGLQRDGPGGRRGGRGGSVLRRLGGGANAGAGDGNDMVMDGGPIGGGGRGGRGRPNPYGLNRPGRGPQGPTTHVEVAIRNWKGNADPNVLFAFLRGKAPQPLDILSHRFNNEEIIIKLKTHSMAQTVQNLNGIRYAGQKLQIQIRNPPRSEIANVIGGQTGAPGGNGT